MEDKAQQWQEEVHLKLGHYNRVDGQPELTKPKSELTLDPEELAELLKTLEENLEPFRAGARKWMTLDSDLGPEQVEQLRALFANPDKRIEFLDEHNIVSADLIKSLDFQKRCRAVEELEAMLDRDLHE